MFPNCFAVRRKVALQCGLIDSVRLPFFNDDASLQLAIKRRGYRVILEPAARTWHDSPLARHDTRTGGSPLRLYYMVRSKIFLERDYDSSRGRNLFALSFPLYLIGYIRMILVAKDPRVPRLSMARVLFEAVVDGLWGRGGLRYDG